ncbi:larval cuticle protein 1-like [Pararge aegeria]|uniref:Jg9535 protein n=1 Tax=Pararge aegeria aegeria TaxID=348720 RepID=A0A8S4RH55_9NEOP|nr:larval cuticle protein 1-like [Pararge aegeria]CAH2237043.1 jg9535 [Pararge aegeria aegeria]
MKSIILALALVAIAAAVPVEKEPIKIVRSELNQNPDGSYSLNVETADGTTRYEVGELKEVLDEDNKPRLVLVVKGSYSYKNDVDKIETINYIADETGFHAEGDSIPRVPAVRR